MLERELDYWRRQLAGAPEVLELPADRPRPRRQSFRGGRLGLRLPASLHRRLEEVARRHGATLFMVLLAGFHVLLHRYSGQDDLLVGSPVANRNRREIEDLIRFFVNTLVLRADLGAVRGSFGELLAQVREATLGAYDHQNLPFEKLVEELQPERDLSRSPLFQVMFALQNAPLSLELPGLKLDVLEIDPGTTRFDLILVLEQTPAGLEGYFSYCRDLFDATTICRLGDHLAALLSAAADPGRRPAELPLLTDAERQQLVREWNDTAATVGGETIPELFARCAVARPRRVAVVCGRRRLTYGRLNQTAPTALANARAPLPAAWCAPRPHAALRLRP